MKMAYRLIRQDLVFKKGKDEGLIHRPFALNLVGHSLR